MKTPSRYLTRSIASRCNCDSEAGRLLCLATSITEGLNRPTMRVIIHPDTLDEIPLAEICDTFETWISQLSLDLYWATPNIAFRAMIEDWSRSLILKTLRLNRATRL